MGERVKRVFFNGKQVEDLQKLLLERFTDLTRHDLSPFLILDKDTKTLVIDFLCSLAPRRLANLFFWGAVWTRRCRRSYAELYSRIKDASFRCFARKFFSRSMHANLFFAQSTGRRPTASASAACNARVLFSLWLAYPQGYVSIFLYFFVFATHLPPSKTHFCFYAFWLL